MNSFQEFEGDIMLYETPDGGEISMEDGLFVADRRFSTAAYLSLFGGNKEDPGKAKNNKEWWGNVLNNVPEKDKLKSRFQNIIIGMPMTIKNIKEAETAAAIDLQWFIEDEIADDILINGQTSDGKQFKLTVDVKKNNLTVFKNEYLFSQGAKHDYSI